MLISNDVLNCCQVNRRDCDKRKTSCGRENRFWRCKIMSSKYRTTPYNWIHVDVCVYLVNPIKWCFTPLLPINLFAVTIFLAPHFVFTVFVNWRSSNRTCVFSTVILVLFNRYTQLVWVTRKLIKIQRKGELYILPFHNNWKHWTGDWWTPAPRTYTREYGIYACVCVHLCNKRKLNIFVEIIKKIQQQACDNKSVIFFEAESCSTNCIIYCIGMWKES